MDREEISQLYHRLGPLIYRRCLKLLANPEHARDATQEVFVRMLDLEDQLLLDWVMGNVVPSDQNIRRLVALMQGD